MLFCLLIFVVLRVVFSDEKTEIIDYIELLIIFFAIILIVSLIVYLVHFAYKKWKNYKTSARRLLVIGDEQCDQNQLLQLFDSHDSQKSFVGNEQ